MGHQGVAGGETPGNLNSYDLQQLGHNQSSFGNASVRPSDHQATSVQTGELGFPVPPNAHQDDLALVQALAGMWDGPL